MHMPHKGALEAILDGLNALLTHKVHPRWVWSRYTGKFKDFSEETAGARESGWPRDEPEASDDANEETQRLGYSWAHFGKCFQEV